MDTNYVQIYFIYHVYKATKIEVVCIVCYAIWNTDKNISKIKKKNVC